MPGGLCIPFHGTLNGLEWRLLTGACIVGVICRDPLWIVGFWHFNTGAAKGCSLVINSELFQFPPERNAVDSEHLGGLGTVAVSHLQNIEDMFGFLLFECRG